MPIVASNSDDISSLEKALKQCFSLNGVGETEEASLSTSLLIIAALRQAQCCYRCILRYLGCFNQNMYTFPLKHLDQAMDLVWGSTQSSIKICTACLGTLQYADDHSLTIQPILDQLGSQIYEASNFALTLTLPVSLLHRDRLLKLYIQEQLDNHTHLWSSTMVRDAKDPIRAIIIQRLALASGLEGDLESPFHINLCLGHPLTESEHLFLTKVKNPVLQLRQVKKRGVITTIGDSRHSITEALKSLDLEEARLLANIPPLPQPERACVTSVILWHDSAFTGGRYNKYSRECSQTPWIIKGQRLADLSVSECITNVFQRHHQCQDVKFVTAGREDADVRMLGTGRPFYCELVNPRRPILSTEEYLHMEQQINASLTGNVVQVRSIQAIALPDTKLIKDGEETKRKSYQALVWLSQPLTDDILDRCNTMGSEEFVTYQKTPVRVFQRRAAAVREKTVYQMTMQKTHDSHLALVTLNTQAGTYIKEFVHGDLGRTRPNLAAIAGVDAADLLDLDVLHVDLVWPPIV